MSKTLFLKPAPGRSVDRPDTLQPWPEDGMESESTLFVRRRLKDGDLIKAERPADAPAETAVIETETQSSAAARSRKTGDK